MCGLSSFLDVEAPEVDIFFENTEDIRDGLISSTGSFCCVMHVSVMHG